MATVHLENCPLCNKISDFEYVEGDAEKRQRFYCDVCKNFVITDTAKRNLLGNAYRLGELSRLSSSLNEDEFLNIFFEAGEIVYRVKSKNEW